ncbi:hypothetical protein A3A79_00120 [Candidatus Gottesmanbacteria bacterium RIFCSPLOWO2_01_FULL_43_11b]|uniref:Excinuclease ABC subunit C n=1 Tax=Candidatus Gottesmanbacteria bacterium RIFCSPLOWO2_01_FULL_43_11b TaxID=1798392 RepID=A0A1F6AGT0_9BACT|nr:MAG: hypothetical protein A3A79_00120 [Candidatus Gottesmanbacteria bacterium RIFCSPLOWO2_01_FULL_43_11b]
MEVSTALTSLPHQPGVYLFRDKSNHVIYVGKAIDLFRRVKSYVHTPLFEHIADIQTIETTSEFDALLLEAKLIREFKPKFNVITKDDKSPLFIVLTLSQPLPRVLFARKTQLRALVTKRGDKVFGPFQSAKMTYSLMQHIRNVIPFCQQKRRDGKPCFYTHLGLCSPCPSVLSKNPNAKGKHIYRRNMIRIKNILNGKATFVLSQMEKEMQSRAKAMRFEQAQVLRNQIASFYELLKRKYDPSVYLHDDGAQDIYREQIEDLANILNLSNLRRIEAIDISNISGGFATGSLVVLTDGRTDKDWYRRFRIRTVRGSNDTAMITEVVRRRFKHDDWPKPDLLVIDGGKGQVRAAAGAPVPVIGLAKRLEEIIVPTDIGFKVHRLSLSRPAIHLLQRIRDEAHRFALRYHRHLRGVSLKSF